MFRMKNSMLGVTPRAGTQVLVRGRISVYEARRVPADRRTPRGGGHRRAAARVRAPESEARAEGLFALERKRSLPRFPRRIA